MPVGLMGQSGRRFSGGCHRVRAQFHPGWSTWHGSSNRSMIGMEAVGRTGSVHDILVHDGAVQHATCVAVFCVLRSFDTDYGCVSSWLFTRLCWWYLLCSTACGAPSGYCTLFFNMIDIMLTDKDK